MCVSRTSLRYASTAGEVIGTGSHTTDDHESTSSSMEGRGWSQSMSAQVRMAGSSQPRSTALHVRAVYEPFRVLPASWPYDAPRQVPHGTTLPSAWIMKLHGPV